MAICDPNVMRLAFDPFEDDSPLIVDPDRIEVLEVALDRSYNAAHYLQSIDRIHRLGLPPNITTNITVLSSVTPQGLASIDHAVSRRLRQKVRDMNAILDDVDLRQIALDEEAADLPVDVDIQLDDLVELFEQLQREHRPEAEEEEI
jgi:hypothetical protein